MEWLPVTLIGAIPMRDDGILTFYELTITSLPGRMPVEQLASVSTAYYGRRTAGVTRLYAAAGANRDFDVLVRCYNTPSLPEGAKFVILEDGNQYRIDMVQEMVDLDAIDLTLVRLEDFYDVAEQ